MKTAFDLIRKADYITYSTASGVTGKIVRFNKTPEEGECVMETDTLDPISRDELLQATVKGHEITLPFGEDVITLQCFRLVPVDALGD